MFRFILWVLILSLPLFFVTYHTSRPPFCSGFRCWIGTQLTPCRQDADKGHVQMKDMALEIVDLR